MRNTSIQEHLRTHKTNWNPSPTSNCFHLDNTCEFKKNDIAHHAELYACPVLKEVDGHLGGYIGTQTR